MAISRPSGHLVVPARSATTRRRTCRFAETAKRWTVCDRYFAAIISDSHAYEDAAEVRPPRSALTRSR